MNVSYNYWLVLLSLVLAVGASYAALSIAARIPHLKSQLLWLWMSGGAISMGLAIWSMHFVGMLAFHIDTPLAYDASLTILSIVYAVAATAIALLIVRSGYRNIFSLLAATLFMGSGIAAMHYTGMAALKMFPAIIYDEFLFVVSLMIAYVASFVALRLFFIEADDSVGAHTLYSRRRLVAAVLMGVAIAGMHYTAMEAAIFAPDAVCGAIGEGIGSGIMSVLIILGVVLILSLTVLLLMLERAISDNRRLQDSERYVRYIINSTPHGMLVTDFSGLIQQVNASLVEMFGYSGDELIGKAVDMLLPGQLREQHRQYRHNYVKSPRKRSMGGNMQLLACRQDGSEFPVEVGLSPIEKDNERFILATVLDITERQKLENELEQKRREYTDTLEKTVSLRTAELQKAKKVAEEANANKGIFLANMSHELRTPMHAIGSFTQLALKRKPDEKISKYLENIQSSTSRLTVLINDLLDLSKLEAGKMYADFEQADIGELIRESLNALDSLISEKDLTVMFDQSTATTGEIDKKLLYQVVTNVLSNAIKFSNTGAKIKITLEEDQQLLDGVTRHVLMFSVSDQGPGIPEAELEKVFDKFVQSSKTKSKAGGTGLGLPICKEIIDLHHGRIWVTSPVTEKDMIDENGKTPGSVFHIVIPLAQQAES